jgi:hypothetical protein
MDTRKMLSEGCESVSRRLCLRHASEYPIGRSGTYSEYWPAHRNRIALASHPYPISLLPSLLFRLLWYTSLYSCHTIIHQPQLHCLGLQHGTAKSTTTTVCGKYCCLMALYMDWGYSPQTFVGLLTPFIPINGCPNYLRRSSVHNPKYCSETDNVTLVWGKLIFQRLRSVTNGYWFLKTTSYVKHSNVSEL